MKKQNNIKIHLISLGCDKNRVDSEKFLYTFLDRFKDAVVVDDVNKANFVIVNTCAFINDAKRESISALKKLIQKKSKNKKLKILVIGCLVKDIREFKNSTKITEFCDKLNLESGKLFKNIDYTLSIDEYSSSIDRCVTLIPHILKFQKVAIDIVVIAGFHI